MQAIKIYLSVGYTCIEKKEKWKNWYLFNALQIKIRNMENQNCIFLQNFIKNSLR